MEGLTFEIAESFLKQYEKEQSELYWKEIQESLKKYKRGIDVINSLHEGQIRNQVILTKI